MGRPLAIHVLEFFQGFDSPRDRATQFGPVRIAKGIGMSIGRESPHIWISSTYYRSWWTWFATTCRSCSTTAQNVSPNTHSEYQTRSLYSNYLLAGFHSPARVGVCAGVGLSCLNSARQAAFASDSMVLSPAMLPPYPESLFSEVISAVALSEVDPLPTVIYAGGG